MLNTSCDKINTYTNIEISVRHEGHVIHVLSLLCSCEKNSFCQFIKHDLWNTCAHIVTTQVVCTTASKFKQIGHSSIGLK